MRRFLLAAFLSVTLLSISKTSVAQTLIHYWNFNNLSVADTFPHIPLLKASYSLIDTNKAYIAYIPQTGATTKSSDSAWIDNVAGIALNAKQGATAGQALRVRNPTDMMELRFYIPTTNYDNIVVQYALLSSSASSGQGTQAFDYSVDSGVTWKTSTLTVNGAKVDTLDVTQAVYQGSAFGLVTIGFGADTTVNNTSKLVLRIKFRKNTTGTSGNNRFDNLTVTGTILSSAISVLTPPAGDTLLAGQHVLISYLTSGVISNFRAIDYSTDSGNIWTEIDISTQDTFTWIVPNNPSNNCFVEVIDQKGIVGVSPKFLIFSTKPIPPPPPPPDTNHTAPPGLIHYWNFSALATADTVPNTPRLKAFYSAIDTNAATITDTLLPGTSKYYVGWFDNVAGDSTNHQLADTSKNALRARNPSDSMEILFNIPSTGYKNLSLQYGLESSSTKSGQLVELFDYSTDGGSTWKTNSLTVQGANVDTLDITNPIFQGTNWGLVTITFGNDTTVDNNPNLVLRMKFRGNNTGTSGNNRLEHVTLEGVSSGAPPPPPVPDSIYVETPSTSDTLLAGTKQTISYTVTATTSTSRSIDYSTNGGSTWTRIATDVMALTYNWIVPATPTTNALIRVMDSTGVLGKSGKFVIVVPGTVASVTLSPFTVIAGKSATILWNATGYLGNTLNIDVAYDGVTWNPIVAGYAFGESTSYQWTAPSTPYNGVIIRVTFASGAKGVSAPFNIVAPAGVSEGSNATANIELWPNPFQSQTTIQYELTSSEDVSLSIHDLVGREVESISEGTQSAGMHTITFDGSPEPAGTYIYELNVGDHRYYGQLAIVR